MSVGLRLLASIADNGSTSVLRMLDADLLVDEPESRVYSFMRQHLRRYGELPTVPTIEEHTSVELPEAPEHIDYYMGEVYNRKVYNGVRDQFAGLRTSVVSNDIPAILGHATQIRALCTPYAGQQRELLTLSEVAEDTRVAYADRASHRGGITGVTTGFQYIDQETSGYQDGDLVTWVARTGLGKTHLLIHQARSAWLSGKSVLFVSMEMTLTQIGFRLAAQHANLEPDYVRKGRLSHFGQRRLHEALDLFTASSNFHLFAGNFKRSTDDVDILIQELAPDAVYIDGMYLMRPSAGSSRAGRFEIVAHVVDDLKRIALTRNRPLIITTQFNRQAGKGGKGGTLETMGYTDALGTHSSVIISVKNGSKTSVPQRQMVMNEHGEEAVAVVGHKDMYYTRLLEIAKGREGEAGTCGVHFKFAPTDFSQCPLSEVSSSMQGSSEANLDYML